jgi:hypothetical protein
MSDRRDNISSSRFKASSITTKATSSCQDSPYYLVWCWFSWISRVCHVIHVWSTRPMILSANKDNYIYIYSVSILAWSRCMSNVDDVAPHLVVIICLAECIEVTHDMSENIKFPWCKQELFPLYLLKIYVDIIDLRTVKMWIMTKKLWIRTMYNWCIE